MDIDTIAQSPPRRQRGIPQPRKTRPKFPRFDDQPPSQPRALAIRPRVLDEAEKAVDALAPASVIDEVQEIPQLRKRKRKEDVEYKPPDTEDERDARDEAKIAIDQPDETKWDKKKKKVYEPNEEVEEILSEAYLPDEIAKIISEASPRLQVWLGFRTETPGGLKRTDLQEPVVKSIDLANAAEVQMYKENQEGFVKKAGGKTATIKGRMCQDFKDAEFYRTMGDIRTDVRTIKPFNNPGFKEAPIEDKSEKPKTSARPQRARNLKLTQKQKDILESEKALAEAGEDYVFEDRGKKKRPAVAKINTANYVPYKDPADKVAYRAQLRKKKAPPPPQ